VYQILWKEKETWMERKTKLINEQIKQTRARTLACTGEGQLFGSSSSRATFLARSNTEMLYAASLTLTLFDLFIFSSSTRCHIYSTLSFALDVVCFFNLQVTS
jgi:glutamate synthase domain-containing protein 1